jgi:hypothetical protein
MHVFPPILNLILNFAKRFLHLCAESAEVNVSVQTNYSRYMHTVAISKYSGE